MPRPKTVAVLDALVEAGWLGKHGSTDQQSGRFDVVRDAEIDLQKVILEQIAAHLKFARIKRGETQAEFAAFLRITIDQLDEMENPHSGLDFERRKLLDEMLDEPIQRRA